MDTGSIGWIAGSFAVALLVNGCAAAYKAINNLQMEIERGATSWFSRCFVWVTGRPAVFAVFLRLSQVACTAVYIGNLMRMASNGWYLAGGLAVFVSVAWGMAGICFRLYPLPMLKGACLLLVVPYTLLYPLTHRIGCLLGMPQSAFETADDYADEVVEESLNDLRENYDASPEYSAEGRMVQNVMELRKFKVRDCMVPSAEIVQAAYEMPLDELVRLFTRTGFSKIPIYKDQPNKIAGYVHAYDLFREPSPTSIAEIIRPIHAVPETIAAGVLLKEMMEKHKSIAAVFDANGNVSGMLTLEDLMEEIFGEIEDEFDVEESASFRPAVSAVKLEI